MMLGNDELPWVAAQDENNSFGRPCLEVLTVEKDVQSKNGQGRDDGNAESHQDPCSLEQRSRVRRN